MSHSGPNDPAMKAKDDQFNVDHSEIDEKGTRIDQRELDEDVQWASRKPNVGQKAPRLSRPVVIPQVAPTLASLFKRAWAPELASHDVRIEEWMQFIDHLNICKTGSPPLQVLSLAGTAVGFIPYHYAALASTATNVAAVGGMVAVARVRITRYLKRVNEEYFVPRGLVARVAKQSNIHDITGQSPDAPMLDEGSVAIPDASTSSDIIERRMQAFRGSVADLQYTGLPALQQEQSTLDRMTAKMNAMKAKRGSKTDDQGNAVSKEQVKLDESRAKAEKEAAKIREKAAKEMEKKPKEQAKIEKEMRKELKKVEEDLQSDEDEYIKKLEKDGEKGDKKLKRLMFIVVQNLEDYVASGRQ